MRTLKILTFSIILISISACSSVRVSSDYDKEVDFTNFKTFDFTQEANDLPIMDLNRRRILNAVAIEMELRGYQKQSSPDLLVNLYVSTEQKVDMTSTTNWYGGSYHYGYWRGYTINTIDVNHYTEGSLFIDLINTENNNLVWQGVGTKTLAENTQNQDEIIKKAVKKIFRQHPITWKYWKKKEK